MNHETSPVPSPHRGPPTVWHALLFETAVLVLAVGLGWIFTANPFGRFAVDWQDATIGLLATVPLLIALWLLQRSSSPELLEFRRTVEELIGPLFKDAPLVAIVALSVMAGVAEEALFRGLLQEGLTGWLGWLTALVVASVIFGLVHWLTRLYAVLAGVVGLYLGALYLVTGNLLVPIVVHVVYDVVALRSLKGVGSRE